MGKTMMFIRFTQFRLSLKYVFLLPSFFLLSNCGYVSDISSREVHTLCDTINQYYLFEAEQRWKETYEYRSPIFRKSVPKDLYIKEMEEDNHGWRLIEYSIISMEKNIDNTMTVRISFKEECPPGLYSFLGKDAKYITIEEDTKWQKIGNKWFCLYCGTRTHIDNNVELVVE